MSSREVGSRRPPGAPHGQHLLLSEELVRGLSVGEYHLLLSRGRYSMSVKPQEAGKESLSHKSTKSYHPHHT